MPEPTVLIEFLRRSYHAVDGLWFMMAEERSGFADALELDGRVWAVLAKIQARKARELTGMQGNGPEELATCFSLKLTADGHEFECETRAAEVRIVVHACPWLALLRKSDRQQLARQVAQRICPTEGRVWGEEFGGKWDFAMPAMQCDGAGQCIMRFVAKSGSGNDLSR